MKEFYVLSGHLTVIGKVSAETQKDAEKVASARHGVACRVTAVDGQTEEEAERFVREALNDDK